MRISRARCSEPTWTRLPVFCNIGSHNIGSPAHVIFTSAPVAFKWLLVPYSPFSLNQVTMAFALTSARVAAPTRVRPLAC
jgi:hypothetical protein